MLFYKWRNSGWRVITCSRSPWKELEFLGSSFLHYVTFFPLPYCYYSLQSCPTLCDPIDGSPPGSLPLGFSRQEHWSGLPFPSPMHESGKWKWSHSVVSDSLQPHAYQAPPSMGFSRQEYWSGGPLPSPFPCPRLILWRQCYFDVYVVIMFRLELEYT